MRIAGVNVGMTRDGRALKDGGACIIEDGDLKVAVAEERLTRRKHHGGFERSLRYCLDTSGLDAADLDAVVVSNCADLPLDDAAALDLLAGATKVRPMPSHHLSHAYLAYFGSPFDEAIVMVHDNEGNILDGSGFDYWSARVERSSYYIARGDKLSPLLETDDRLEPGELGPGEVYRHFTYYLGWHSYVHAGKTMGLAPYGDPTAVDARLFDLRHGQIHSGVHNGRDDPTRAVVEFGQRNGIHLASPRSSASDPLTEHHCHVAALVQAELERALIYKARVLHAKTGITNLCLGGGVALNCVANRRLLEETPFERLYVPYAPGDTGQCLGNALFGWYTQPAKSGPKGSARVGLEPYVGRSYTSSEVRAALSRCGDRARIHRTTDVPRDVAGRLAGGQVVGWFQGRSELGPRALGNRSILADPRPPQMKSYLNDHVKRREGFRPFAPAVLEGGADDYFDLVQRSPFMELTASVWPHRRGEIPAVVHVDGSARVQTVNEAQNKRFHSLLTAFNDITGTPVLLNTSFNLGGEPIVESPADAIETFLACPLDVVVVDDYIVEKAQLGR